MGVFKMIFEKNIRVTNDSRVDTLKLTIPFDELLEKAVEEFTEVYTENPEVYIDYDEGIIVITEVIEHGM